MRQEDGRKMARYRSPSERNDRWLEPSKQLRATLAAGRRRRDEGLGFPHSVRYLHDTFDMTTLAFRTLAVVVWHRHGKPDVLSWPRYGSRDVGSRDSGRSGSRHGNRQGSWNVGHGNGDSW